MSDNSLPSELFTKESFELLNDSVSHKQGGGESFDLTLTGSSFSTNSVSSKESSSSSSNHIEIDPNVDFFVIETDQGSFQLQRSSLTKCLEELKPYANTYIKNLPQDVKDSYHSIVETLKLLKGSDAYHNIILKDIHKAFASKEKGMKPGTVSAFFSACFGNDGFTGPYGCNLKCAVAFHGVDEKDIDPDMVTVCEDLILIYKDGSFGAINEKESSHAYIYVDGNNFQGFTKDNIETLKKSGIYEVALIFGNDDGSYKEVGSYISVHELPILKHGATNKSSHKNNGTTTTTVNNSGIWAVVVVLIIIGLLLLLVYKQSYFL
jgi:hypothetical protein